MQGQALPEAALEFSSMDDIWLDGCWLEMADSTDFFQPNAPSPAILLDSFCFPPSSVANNCNSNPCSPQNAAQRDNQGFSPIDNPPSVRIQTENPVRLEYFNESETRNVEASASESYLAEERGKLDDLETINRNFEVGRRWWIEPSTNTGPVSSVKERLMKALRFIKESSRDGDVLVQIWVPIRKGGRQFLTTCDQPFELDPNCQRLVDYRTVSIKYLFAAEENSNEAVGLPGRVFLGKLPEWTPDVQYFSSDEYPRVTFAQQCNVRGTIALPIFEQSNWSCLGVIEVVRTTQKINYRPELENICNALQAVNLRSSGFLGIPHVKVGNNSYQVVVPEILGVLRAVCEAHRLPLAQTWVPCKQQGKIGSRHSDEDYSNCVSTLDAACYVRDPHVWDFHEACSEHHLFRGQGVTGMAFTTNQPCFSSDITAFTKSDYPLSHYAKMFGLQAAVAVRLRSVHTGVVDYVLEFFLPASCSDSEHQKLMLNSLSIVMQQVCRSLRIITDKELEEETTSAVSNIKASNGTIGGSSPVLDERSNGDKMQNGSHHLLIEVSSDESSQVTSCRQASQKEDSNVVPMPLILKFEEAEALDVGACHDNQPGSFDDIGNMGDSSFGEPRMLNSGKTMERRRTKLEKTISLQVLQQYFAGSLKDAAKSIGVCPTTLKRICRQHGITRWPSRKIKKVDHSLRKLKVVIDSVQGAGGAFNIPSLSPNFRRTQSFLGAYGSDLTSQNQSGSSTFSTLKHMDCNSKSLMTETEVAPGNSPSSSCSQTSSSSLSCSTAGNQSAHASELHENQSGTLNRSYSEVELCASWKEESKPPARSLSEKSLLEHVSFKSPTLSQPSHITKDGGIFRVKVTYGEDQVRFRQQPSWGFQELQREIAKRFGINDTSTIDLKYLDDDSEWVLLTCDADLAECEDVYKSSVARAIKLSVHTASHLSRRNFLGNRGPS
ncbi:hypothetical protein ACLOJK_002410 [Asimina triloba]